MKFYRKAEETAKQIVNAFREPDKLPAALAPVFIRRRDNVPCRQWSWSNQLLVAIHGHSDARGFRQWQDAGRHVKKGEKSFPILCPYKKKVELTDEETGEKRKVFVIYGFTTANVFGQSQTDGEPLPDPDPAMTEWLRNLPLRDVANHWGLSVETFDGDGSGYRGMYRHGQAIALGVKNLSTWCHELMHAADDRVQGGLKGGQHLDQETVAQLGASILLQAIGHDHDADLGHTWEYVNHYAQREQVELITACERVLKRTCDAVALILDTAEELQQAVA